MARNNRDRNSLWNTFSIGNGNGGGRSGPGRSNPRAQTEGSLTGGIEEAEWWDQVYDPDFIPGCPDPTAGNYNPAAEGCPPGLTGDTSCCDYSTSMETDPAGEMLGGDVYDPNYMDPPDPNSFCNCRCHGPEFSPMGNMCVSTSGGMFYQSCCPPHTGTGG